MAVAMGVAAGYTTSSASVKKWEGMWAAGLQPGAAFDCQQCEPAFAELLAPGGALAGGTGRALVPGCGRGYAVASLAAAGYHTTGLELAASAVTAAQKYLNSVDGIATKWDVIEADFFTHSPPSGGYDLIYDCTFLCAIPPEAREKWADTMAQLLAPSGELVTLIFPVKDVPYEGGPPYSMSTTLVRGLLETRGFFATALDEVPQNKLARGSFAREFLGRWKRR